MKTLNIIGRQVQKLRVANRWTQDVFAKELQKVGLNKSRAGVGRIEARLVAVKEYELLFLAKALGVRWGDLFPDIDPKRKLYDRPDHRTPGCDRGVDETPKIHRPQVAQEEDEKSQEDPLDSERSVVARTNSAARMTRVSCRVRYNNDAGRPCRGTLIF